MVSVGQVALHSLDLVPFTHDQVAVFPCVCTGVEVAGEIQAPIAVPHFESSTVGVTGGGVPLALLQVLIQFLLWLIASRATPLQVQKQPLVSPTYLIAPLV